MCWSCSCGCLLEFDPRQLSLDGSFRGSSGFPPASDSIVSPEITNQRPGSRSFHTFPDHTLIYLTLNPNQAIDTLAANCHFVLASRDALWKAIAAWSLLLDRVYDVPCTSSISAATTADLEEHISWLGLEVEKISVSQEFNVDTKQLHMSESVAIPTLLTANELVGYGLHQPDVVGTALLAGRMSVWCSVFLCLA